MSTRERFMSGAPIWLLRLLDQATWIRKPDWRSNSQGGAESQANGDTVTETVVQAGDVTAQAVASTDAISDLHAIILDIDVPAALIPSSTPGHAHLYIDRWVRWDDYVELLAALVKCGVIEKGFYDMSYQRGATYARLPWIKKGAETNSDADVPAVDIWLMGQPAQPSFDPF